MNEYINLKLTEYGDTGGLVKEIEIVPGCKEYFCNVAVRYVKFPFCHKIILTFHGGNVYTYEGLSKKGLDMTNIDLESIQPSCNERNEYEFLFQDIVFRLTSISKSNL